MLSLSESSSTPAAGPPPLRSSPTRIATSQRGFSAGACSPGRQIQLLRLAVPQSRRKASLPGHRGSLTQETRKARLRAPSLQHRIDACMSWRKRLHRLASALAIPGRTRFRFDMQLLRKPGNLVVAYQQVNAPPATKSGNTFSRNSHSTARLGHHRCTFCTCAEPAPWAQIAGATSGGVLE
jgi:hypothetical protein